MKTGTRTLWIKTFKAMPSLGETVCIVFHDIGYATQDTIDGADNRHPELGARMCGVLGQKYYDMCIAHSRDYARKLGLPLSKLGYADKGSVLQYPDWFFKRLIVLGGEAQEYYQTTKTRKWGIPVQVCLIKADYQRWIDNNKWVGG